MTTQAGYVRGAFVVFAPGGYRSNDESKRRIIPFRFNPEGLSRNLTIEQGQGGQGVEAPPRGGGGGGGQQVGDAAGGRLKQSFQINLRMDFADREEARGPAAQQGGAETDALGILPELCALEDLLYPAASDTNDNSDGREPVAPRGPRPTVLLVWGVERVFPVKITGMSINETLHNPQLNPIRAEVNVSVEVASDADARDSLAFQDALDFGNRQRRRMARRFYATAASQGTRIPDLTGGGR